MLCKVGRDMIYSCIDIGSDTVKIVVGEINEEVHILSRINYKMDGIKKGLIKDKEMVIKSLKGALDKSEKDLGFRIDKAVISVPIYDMDVSLYHGLCYPDGKITGDDVITCFKSVVSNIDSYNEVVTVFPIDFTIDDEIKTINPIGIDGNKLESRVLISTIPKEIVIPFFEVLKEVGVEVIDLSIGLINDFYNISNDQLKEGYTALVDLGHDKCEVGVFNKGILIKSDILNFGSKLVDYDIGYIYNVDKETARYLKENLALASCKFAENDEKYTYVNDEDEKVIINQNELSQIVEERLKEILKNVKNSINSLTNHKISYIIIAGGISNLPCFDYLVSEIFGEKAYSINLNNIGLRNNIYTSSYGMIKYYYDKLKVRGINYTMYDNIEEMVGNKKKDVEDNIISEIKKYLENN